MIYARLGHVTVWAERRNLKTQHKIDVLIFASQGILRRLLKAMSVELISLSVRTEVALKQKFNL